MSFIIFSFLRDQFQIRHLSSGVAREKFLKHYLKNSKKENLKRELIRLFFLFRRKEEFAPETSTASRKALVRAWQRG
jgi:hypothetical protein